ncbi:cell division protein ZipA [Pseudomonas sp. OIL-1]|uniref:cell division protein ZipA n=1 Tax=Pseudomonas sp. OIL-1 TaxID=2706126 RepID=UPI0013A7688F|nr:cell division protein ZipA [Pseudomonas sp. OIL-1]QIB52659.1 cell division protein ZipA [Pseudomonas sp. OIL-1]
MDFGLREWLIIIGVLVIAGILFDGWRRMGGRSRIRIKLERNLTDDADTPPADDLLGPPRVIGRKGRSEPSVGRDLSELDDLGDNASVHSPEQTGLDLGGLNLDDIPEPPSVQDTRGTSRPRKVTPRAPDMPRREPRMAEKDEQPTRTEPELSAEPATAREELPPVEEVFVINVVARDELGFPGSALLQNILESGLRHGEMNIFHRHESMSGNGDVLFSMANALKPGVFDLDEMDSTYVRAVSFFMGLPGPRHPKQALDLMIAAARKLSHELGGDLKDEQRSVLTAQTIEHYRQRIAEYERKRFSQRRSY